MLGPHTPSLEKVGYERSGLHWRLLMLAVPYVSWRAVFLILGHVVRMWMMRCCGVGTLVRPGVQGQGDCHLMYQDFSVMLIWFLLRNYGWISTLVAVVKVIKALTTALWIQSRSICAVGTCLHTMRPRAVIDHSLIALCPAGFVTLSLMPAPRNQRPSN